MTFALQMAKAQASQNSDSLMNPIKISNYFAQMVFGAVKQKEYLSKKAVEAIANAGKGKNSIDAKVADEIATGMQNWAMANGATHYTHWFQPLRGNTAEKHDSFFEPTGQDTGVEAFSGKSLVQQEPDASSFPNGGIRNTFEARGYTAWDPSSPAFIMNKAGVKTLCIPTIFISYTGEALDYKAPMLKSTAALRKISTEVIQAFFDPKVKDCSVSLGVEQEYFLIDKQLFEQRPDLVLSGRTLLGSSPAKGQQLDDHYFGAIPHRVLAFMSAFEEEAHLLGIPLRTRHNEVAPSQFECAPQYEEVNLAIDHNCLLMDVMESVADDLGLKVLFHEKPFAGVNGSGKHNNWSIVTNTGVNVFSPGPSPADNQLFLTFFINAIRAVKTHADLLRASIATAGNDHRLGANEAPPAIMSVYIGAALGNVIEKISGSRKAEEKIKSGSQALDSIPNITFDNTDRNRTSPFAFTGNKWEFRAVGSNDNCSSAMMVLNTIMADQLTKFKADVEAKIKGKVKKEDAISLVLKEYVKESKHIIFGGNGYSKEWVAEAKKRGLNNILNTPDALEVYTHKSSVGVFERTGVLTGHEIEARNEIKYEDYILRLQIEGRVINDLVNGHIIPSAISYQSKIAENIKTMIKIGQPKHSLQAQIEIVTEISEHVNAIYNLSNEMAETRGKANVIDDAHKRAKAYCNMVKPMFDQIRKHCDRLEDMVDDQAWTLPKYRELLYSK
jgi:glutamine synthetase